MREYEIADPLCPRSTQCNMTVVPLMVPDMLQYLKVECVDHIKICSTMKVEHAMEMFWYKVRASVLDLVTDAGFLEMIRSERFILFVESIRTETDRTNCFSILSDGKFSMILDKATYHSLGLSGRPAERLKKRKEVHRLPEKQYFVVEIDLKHASFAPGNSLFERVKWCLSSERIDPAEFSFFLYDKQDRKCVEFTFPRSFEYVKQDLLKIEKSAALDFKIPDFAKVASMMNSWENYENDDEWAQDELQEACNQLDDWIGLLHYDAKYALERLGKYEEYPSTSHFQLPELDFVDSAAEFTHSVSFSGPIPLIVAIELLNQTMQTMQSNQFCTFMILYRRIQDIRVPQVMIRNAESIFSGVCFNGNQMINFRNQRED